MIINMMNYFNVDYIVELCKKIGMANEPTDKVLEVINTEDFTKLEPLFAKLIDIETAAQAYSDICEIYKEHPNKGFIWLTISLGCALTRLDIYHEMGISDEIFYKTMACLSRFVDEHKQSYGEYGFDRQFWSYRQLCGVIYRLGELEFEMVKYQGDELLLNGTSALKDGDNIISVHIPSDARINSENNHKSYHQAVEFLAKFYPQYEYCMFYCNSWLMSPRLKEVLPTASNILQYQNDYEIVKDNEDDMGYLLWVFKKSDISVEDLPEDTSLQRNIKAYVKNGGKIGGAAGVIHKSKCKKYE